MKRDGRELLLRPSCATRWRRASVYTAQDWERNNAGSVYESTTEMDAALDEYCALPDAESAYAGADIRRDGRFLRPCRKLHKQQCTDSSPPAPV